MTVWVVCDQAARSSLGRKSEVTAAGILYMISDMKENPTLQALDEKILRLKQQLLALGPLHPGSLSQSCHEP